MARLEGRQFVLNRATVMLPSYLPDLLQRLSGLLNTGHIRLDLPAELPPCWPIRNALTGS